MAVERFVASERILNRLISLPIYFIIEIHGGNYPLFCSLVGSAGISSPGSGIIAMLVS